MSASHYGFGRPAAVDTRPLAATVTAAAVGVLLVTTLGTTTAVIVGTLIHLVGVPDAWAIAAAAAVWAASVVPSAALSIRVWTVERHGLDAEFTPTQPS